MHCSTEIPKNVLASILTRRLKASMDSGEICRMNAVFCIIEKERFCGPDGLFNQIEHDPLDFLLCAAPSFDKYLKLATGLTRSGRSTRFTVFIAAPVDYIVPKLYQAPGGAGYVLL
jgi:hypothetical protein